MLQNKVENSALPGSRYFFVCKNLKPVKPKSSAGMAHSMVGVNTLECRPIVAGPNLLGLANLTNSHKVINSL